MSTTMPVAAFINLSTQKQLKKRTGGVKTVWTEAELADLRKIAYEVSIGNFSRSQALKDYREARKSGKNIGAIRPNKSPTAFKLRLSEMLREPHDPKA